MQEAYRQSETAKYDFAVPDTLDETEISYILTRADELAKWAGDVKEFALEQALAGTSYPGFKVVEGRSVRKYTKNEESIDDMQIKTDMILMRRNCLVLLQ